MSAPFLGGAFGEFAFAQNTSAAPGAFTLVANSGSFTITGTAADLEKGFYLSVESGSYTVTGTAATLKKGFYISAVSGSYTVTGAAATLKATRLLTAATGSYSISGTAASLLFGRLITAVAGSYTITVGDVTLTRAVAPVSNLVAPVVSGTLTRGSTLSCTTGTWAGTLIIDYIYQWRQGGVNIPEAKSSTYVVIGANVGKDISCIVTASNYFSISSQVSNTVTITGSRSDVSHKRYPKTKWTWNSPKPSSR